eukprot:gene9077-12242_t
MQRLVEKIWGEFSSSNSHHAEIFVLDGNGDPFEVYNGELAELSAHEFQNILREPSCFYFFNISSLQQSLAVANEPENQIILRKELCWLTDPVPPQVSQITHNSFLVSWTPIHFCGIDTPLDDILNTIYYSVEISEGGDYKEGVASRYVNDSTTSGGNMEQIKNYKSICYNNNTFSVKVTDLKPAKWYHIRLVIDYLGFNTSQNSPVNSPYRIKSGLSSGNKNKFEYDDNIDSSGNGNQCKVFSDPSIIHTHKSIPSIPSIPRMQVAPTLSVIENSSTENPILNYQILFSWTPSNPNGSSITKYQLQLRKFDFNKNILFAGKKTKHNVRKDSIYELLKFNQKSPNSNQWTRSNGKSSTQIRNVLQLRNALKSAPTSLTNQENSIFSAGHLKLSNNNSSFSPQRQQNKLHNGGLSQSLPTLPSLSFSHDSVNNNHSNSQNRSEWSVIYCNLQTHIRVPSPNPNEGEWHLRVRACNRMGWSGYSPILKINGYTHPTLFDAKRVAGVHNEEDLKDFLLDDDEDEEDVISHEEMDENNDINYDDNNQQNEYDNNNDYNNIMVNDIHQNVPINYPPPEIAIEKRENDDKDEAIQSKTPFANKNILTAINTASSDPTHISNPFIADKPLRISRRASTSAYDEPGIMLSINKRTEDHNHADDHAASSSKPNSQPPNSSSGGNINHSIPFSSKHRGSKNYDNIELPILQNNHNFDDYLPAKPVDHFQLEHGYAEREISPFSFNDRQKDLHPTVNIDINNKNNNLRVQIYNKEPEQVINNQHNPNNINKSNSSSNPPSPMNVEKYLKKKNSLIANTPKSSLIFARSVSMIGSSSSSSRRGSVNKRISSQSNDNSIMEEKSNVIYDNNNQILPPINNY